MKPCFFIFDRGQTILDRAHNRRQNRRRPRGGVAAFTLLEVMVAVVVLAVGMTVLLQVQARSAQMAQQAKAMTVATQLARSKLYDCEVEMLKRGFSIGDFKEVGRFDDEGYDRFFWECHGYKPELPMPDAADITEAATNAASGANGASSQPTAGGPPQPPPLDPGMLGAGMGMIAPVIAQISELIGESIRELTVIVRWKEGNTWEELRVTTHLTDTSGVNAIAPQIEQMSNAFGGLPGAN